MNSKKMLNIKIALAFVIGMMVSSLSICMAVNVISSKNVTYENTQSHLEANNVQDAVDELFNHATDYTNTNNIINALDVGGLNDNISTTGSTMYHSTGAITSNALRYKIIGKHIVLSGRLEVRIDSRTGANPGVQIVLPNSKTIRTGFGIHVGPCTTTGGARNGESTMIDGQVNANKITILTSETHTNVSAGQTLVFYIPMTFIPIQ